MLPAGVPAESSQLSTDGAYLLDNGRIFLLWLGHSVSREFVAQVQFFQWTSLVVLGSYFWRVPAGQRLCSSSVAGPNCLERLGCACASQFRHDPAKKLAELPCRDLLATT